VPRSMRAVLGPVIVSLVVSGTLVVGTGSATASLGPVQLARTTDRYLHKASLAAFQTARAKRPHARQLDWSSDGCSHAPDNPFGFNLVRACHRHDFGYRNYKRQGRFTEAARLRIDNRFRSDMYVVCAGRWACNRFADAYYAAVRQYGGG
jgi:Prokaryotic phospholipase A2